MQLITSGGDGLLKLWNIKTSECISTLDQHESHVWTLVGKSISDLHVQEYLAIDVLITKHVMSFSLVAKDEKHIISGGSDSLLVIWRDVTEEKKVQAAKEKERFVFEEQKLANLLKAEELQAALRLALKMERPLQVLKIIEGITTYIE